MNPRWMSLWISPAASCAGVFARDRPRAVLVLADGEERDVAEQVVAGANDAVEPGFLQSEVGHERLRIGRVELRDLELDLRADRRPRGRSRPGMIDSMPGELRPPVGLRAGPLRRGSGRSASASPRGTGIPASAWHPRRPVRARAAAFPLRAPCGSDPGSPVPSSVRACCPFSDPARAVRGAARRRQGPPGSVRLPCCGHRAPDRRIRTDAALTGRGTCGRRGAARPRCGRRRRRAVPRRRSSLRRRRQCRRIRRSRARVFVG